MVIEMNGRELIEEIRNSIEADKGRRLWVDTVRAVSLVSELVFTRSSHFVMEFIQNAEDAGMGGQPADGEMTIRVSQERVLITHNARPFNEDDVDAICGLRTTKKPELGSIGYLGIGSKSCFKVTDSPHIFSGEFHFKFDKNAWETPDEVPWQIIPLPVETLPEHIEPAQTTFYLPFRDERSYEETRNEFKNIGLHLYLFLKWLKKITVIDEGADETTILENLGEENRIITLARNGEEERYLMFRRVCEVPRYVAEDEITRNAKRSNVKQREITAAFKVDENDNLVSLASADAHGGIYSFLPLGEEKSGAKFLIQSDFIVVPGRESINYEAVWNHWLFEQMTELVKEAIETFKQHSVWRKQYLPLFEFATYWGQPSFAKLFHPKLHLPLQEYLNHEPIPTDDGGFTDSKNAVVVPTVVRELLSSDNDIGKLLSSEKEAPKMVLPNTELGHFASKVTHLDILKVAKNKDFLQEKAKEPDAVEWFLKLYSKLYDWAKGYASGPAYLRSQGYLPVPVLTEDLEIKEYDEVHFKSLPSEVIELSKKYSEAAKILSSVLFLHPSLENELSEFFETYIGLKRLDYSKICKEMFLPKISITETPPSNEKLVAYTCLLHESDIHISDKIWVLTKSDDTKSSAEVFFSAEYSPAQTWEKNKKYVPGIEFLSAEYIQNLHDIEEINRWRRFFSDLKVKEHGPKNHVDDFGVNFALEKLRSESVKGKLGYHFVGFENVEKQNLGYDFIGKTSEGDNRYLEVKSRVQASDIELTPHETDIADRYGDDYLLCIVEGIPENPELYIIPNPVKHGKKEKVVIPKTVWNGFKLDR